MYQAALGLAAGSDHHQDHKDGTITEVRIPDGASVVEVEKDGQFLGKVDVLRGTMNSPTENREKPPTSESPSNLSADQRAAQWLLSMNARFTLQDKEGATRWISSAAELPPEPSQIIVVDLKNFSDSVTDASLANLSGLQSLKSLILVGCTKVTDAGISHLASCPAIEHANLAFVPITDRGVDAFLKIQYLKELDLSESLLGDEGAGSSLLIQDLRCFL